MRPINKQDLRPEYVVYSMVQKMNAGLYSLSSLPGAPQDNAEVPSGSHTSSTLPSSLDNLSLLRVSPPPSTAASILPGLSSDDEMEVDEIVSASKSGEKVQTLKNTALLEMEKWAMSEGRMQDVLNSRQRIDSAWTPEKRIKYYQTFVGLKETLQSQKWKCVENGRMPCPYIYSFLGKTRHTFTRMRSCLSKETEDVSAEQLEDEDERYHTTAVHASLLPPTPPSVVASLVPRLSNDNLDDRMDVDELSTSKLESKLVKNTNLKNAAFLEMEKWAMS
ncbi:hypothetical protein BT96DRAFT_254969 [Gymnopus androsaceus JB14]|uniref:Uncharacterized protein n=1 Tax=Gymnopus androsaceus JB14 TaxID=1447944 RepID=A0A6A4H499_9AGAR|nr:hypothetical protein BT96DRAFT_254969 [Gymnopus androsaceus JB14]